MRKILKFLFIIQSVTNTKRKVKLGRGFSEAHRLNPFNPLSYLTLVLSIFLGLILFGVVGFWKEADLRNPFKWN